MPSNSLYCCITYSCPSNCRFPICFPWPQSPISARGKRRWRHAATGPARAATSGAAAACPSASAGGRSVAVGGSLVRMRGRAASAAILRGGGAGGCGCASGGARGGGGGDAEAGQHGEHLRAGRRLRVLYGPRLFHVGVGRASGAGTPLYLWAAADAAQHGGQHRRLFQRRGEAG